jgi:small-conductance mechanosensitive channel
MDIEKITSWIDQAQPILVAFGLKALGAIAVFVVGRWPISVATSLLGAGMSRHKLDPTVQRDIAKSPTVDVEILEFNAFGPKLAVRPYCHTDHYWQVYFDTNKAIADTLGAAGFPVATRPVKIYPV